MTVRHFAGVAGIVAAAVLATFTVTRAVYSQDDPGNGAGKAPSDEEMKKILIERAALVEEHRKLGSLVGTWDVETVCMKDGVEKRSKGTMTTESLLGGRALLSKFEGEMDGTPFEGVELRGFDKEKNKHWSVWADSFGTASMRSTGERGASGDIVLKSEEWDFMGKPFTSHFVTKTIDADKWTMEMTNSTPGMPEEKSTMTFVRRGASPK